MLRPFMITLASFVAALVAFSFLMGVSKMDVSIKHEMQRHVVAEPFEAGDVIVLAGDGVQLLYDYGHGTYTQSGSHSGLTSQEMVVPLIVVPGD